MFESRFFYTAKNWAFPVIESDAKTPELNTTLYSLKQDSLSGLNTKVKYRNQL